MEKTKGLSSEPIEDQTDGGEITVTENSFQSVSFLPGKDDNSGEETIIIRNIFHDLTVDTVNPKCIEIAIVECGRLESVGKFMINKFRNKYQELDAVTVNSEDTYVNQLSERLLYKPSAEFMKSLLQLRNIF